MKFNEKIISLRKMQGYTQEMLAEKLEVTRQAISRWESGETTPEMNLLKKLCSIFNVSADYLLNDDLDEPGNAPASLPKEQGNIPTAQRKKCFLILAVLFCVAALCSIYGMIISPLDFHLIIASAMTILFIGLSIIEFYCYFTR